MEKQETPEFTRIVELLQDAGLKDRKAVELTERMSNIASQNTIAQFGSELRAGLEGLRAELKSQRESQEAKMDAQNSKYNVLIWMIGLLRPLSPQSFYSATTAANLPEIALRRSYAAPGAITPYRAPLYPKRPLSRSEALSIV